MNSLLYKKQVDWSLMKDGFTLPVSLHSLLRSRTNLRLEIGEKRSINILIDGKQFAAQLINTNFDREKYPDRKEIIQIRYSPNSPISQYFRKVFEISYRDISAQKELAGKRLAAVSRIPEYFCLYTTEKQDVFVGQAITGYDLSSVAEGRIIAINEGVLADFLGKTAELKKLADVIDEYYRNEGKSDLPPGLMIINLNLRSVTAANDGAESLFRKQLKNLCQPKFWTGCQNCPNKEFCFIKYNVDTFNDYAAGNEVLNRLEWMLRMTGYRRELHITIRDLRSFISFLITADCRCEDIAKIYEQSQNPEDYWKYYYFNIIAHDGLPSQDRLITLLRKTDVALVPIPNIDRTLYSSRLDEKFFNCFADRKQTLLAEFDARKMTLREQEDGNKYILKAHQIFIRHHFFEGNFEFFKSKHTFFSRMPYKFLRHFWGLMRGDEAIEQSTREALPKAFARSAGCLDSPFIKDYLLLPASHENDPYGKTYRRFPLSDFELLIENPTHLVTYIEYENSNAIFRHKGANEQFISLNITLDLFDMLFYIEGGFSPSLNDLQGHFLEMQVFKTRLENMLYHELLITRNNKNFYLAKLDSATNKIQISELEEVEE